MEKAKQRDRPGVVRGWVSDVLLVLGAAAVTAGAGLLCTAAGFIVGGVLAIAGGVLCARGGGGEEG